MPDLHVDASPLIKAWFRAFGTAAIDLNRVLDVALDEDDRLWLALVEVDHTLRDVPQPRQLRRLLVRLQNLPHEVVPLTDESPVPVRFTREAGSGRWRLSYARNLSAHLDRHVVLA
jgi:hypothetical protein